ncbi:MAG: hypothetical protein ACJ77A_04990 [Actinomycetota bacterium]
MTEPDPDPSPQAGQSGEGRLTGEHWWDPDRDAHVDDLPRHCPRCASVLDLETGISVEYWEGDRRIYHTWCQSCGWTGDIIKVDRMVGHEAED